MERINIIVSVIVPAYNAEKYLSRCLTSIAQQNLKDFETIIIDDGSIDNTYKIAASYAEKDSRFKVYHQNNQGVSVARQKGLDLARGKYTIHVDSDDWIEPEMLSQLVDTAEAQNADMVICDFIVHWKTHEELWKQQPVNMASEQVLGQMMYNLYGSLCNKLIKTECYTSYGIRISNGLDVCEDQYTILKILSHKIIIAYIPKALYNYDRTQNDQSLVNNGISASQRLRPLEMIAKETDISSIMDYYNNAIFMIAHEYVYLPNSSVFNYSKTFKKHIHSIFRAKGFPFHSKILVLLRIININLPHTIINRFRSEI